MAPGWRPRPVRLECGVRSGWTCTRGSGSWVTSARGRLSPAPSSSSGSNRRACGRSTARCPQAGGADRCPCQAVCSATSSVHAARWAGQTAGGRVGTQRAGPPPGSSPRMHLRMCAPTHRRGPPRRCRTLMPGVPLPGAAGVQVVPGAPARWCTPTINLARAPLRHRGTVATAGAPVAVRRHRCIAAGGAVGDRTRKASAAGSADAG